MHAGAWRGLVAGIAGCRDALCIMLCMRKAGVICSSTGERPCYDRSPAENATYVTAVESRWREQA